MVGTYRNSVFVHVRLVHRLIAIHLRHRSISEKHEKSGKKATHEDRMVVCCWGRSPQPYAVSFRGHNVGCCVRSCRKELEGKGMRAGQRCASNLYMLFGMSPRALVQTGNTHSVSSELLYLNSGTKQSDVAAINRDEQRTGHGTGQKATKRPRGARGSQPIYNRIWTASEPCGMGCLLMTCALHLASSRRATRSQFWP
jgi:hypothetical protein